MKNFASGNGRCEFGFYIYYNKNTNTYSYGEIVQGTVIQGHKETNANVSLGKVVDNTTVCAFFHCHTTLRYCPKETMRRTGPSSANKSFASKNKLPGILYDYAKREIRGEIAKIFQRRYICLVHQGVLSNLNNQYSGLYYEVLVLCFCDGFGRRFIICPINKYRQNSH